MKSFIREQLYQVAHWQFTNTINGEWALIGATQLISAFLVALAAGAFTCGFLGISGSVANIPQHKIARVAIRFLAVAILIVGLSFFLVDGLGA